MDSSDPRLRTLTLRAEAAEESLIAAKVHRRVTSLESRAARLLLSRLGRYEESAATMARGQHYYSRMKEHRQALAEQDAMKDVLEPEIERKKEKAVKLVAQAKEGERRVAELERRIRSLLEEAEGLRKERDRHIIEARKLEAEAVRIESLY